VRGNKSVRNAWTASVGKSWAPVVATITFVE
jgi:hypothetical protein